MIRIHNSLTGEKQPLDKAGWCWQWMTTRM